MSRTIEVVIEVRVQIEVPDAEDDQAVARTEARYLHHVLRRHPGFQDADVEEMSWDAVEGGAR